MKPSFHALLRLAHAATPAGVVSVASGYRGCRSFLAQPPANRWHPSGMIHADQAKEVFASYPVAMVSASHAGGLEAISRWLRSAATIPPEPNAQTPRIPEGCQP